MHWPFQNALKSAYHSGEPFFKESAEKHNLDWLFLAAISYQESLLE